MASRAERRDQAMYLRGSEELRRFVTEFRRNEPDVPTQADALARLLELVREQYVATQTIGLRHIERPFPA